MGIRYDSTSDWLQYVSGPVGACTIAGYFQVLDTLKTSTFLALASHAPGANDGNSQAVAMKDATGAISAYIAGWVDFGFDAELGDWVFAALSRNGDGGPATVWRAHAALLGAASLVSSSNYSNGAWNLTGNRIQIATSPYAGPNNQELGGASAPIWVYDSVLTPSELDAQRKVLTPVKTPWLYVPGNLTGADRAKDQSGNGRDFTANGTLADVSGPSFGDVTLYGSVTMSDEHSAVTVTDVSISPVSLTVNIGATADITVTVENNGVGVESATGTITSSAESRATVTQLGATDSNGKATLRVTGVAAGGAVITAEFDGVSDTCSVQVSGLPLPWVAISPSEAPILVGESVQFSATSGDEEPVTWSATLGTIGADGLYTASSVAPGTAIVRAALTSDPSVYDEAVVLIHSDSAFATAAPRFTKSGGPLANTELDYWVIGVDDEPITWGSGTTDADGVLSIRLDVSHVGESVNVVVNNLKADMSTAGKIHQQKVVTVA